MRIRLTWAAEERGGRSPPVPADTPATVFVCLLVVFLFRGRFLQSKHEHLAQRIGERQSEQRLASAVWEAIWPQGSTAIKSYLSSEILFQGMEPKKLT